MLLVKTCPHCSTMKGLHRTQYAVFTTASASVNGHCQPVHRRKYVQKRCRRRWQSLSAQRVYSITLRCPHFCLSLGQAVCEDSLPP